MEDFLKETITQFQEELLKKNFERFYGGIPCLISEVIRWYFFLGESQVEQTTLGINSEGNFEGISYFWMIFCFEFFSPNNLMKHLFSNVYRFLKQNEHKCLKDFCFFFFRCKTFSMYPCKFLGKNPKRVF